MPVNFEVLYFFSNGYDAIVEIQRKDNPAEKDLSKVFFWLIYELKKDQLSRLHFVSMDNTVNPEIREFKEGRFLFDEENGTFFESSGNLQIKMDRSTADEITNLLVNRIEDFMIMTNNTHI